MSGGRGGEKSPIASPGEALFAHGFGMAETLPFSAAQKPQLCSVMSGGWREEHFPILSPREAAAPDWCPEDVGEENLPFSVPVKLWHPHG